MFTLMAYMLREEIRKCILDVWILSAKVEKVVRKECVIQSKGCLQSQLFI